MAWTRSSKETSLTYRDNFKARIGQFIKLSSRNSLPLFSIVNLRFFFSDKLAPFPSGGTTWEGLPTNELVLEEPVDKKNNIL